MKKIILVSLALILVAVGGFGCDEISPSWMIAQGETEAGTYEPILLDAINNSQVIVDFAHHEIHEEHSYYLKSYVDLANGNVYDLRLSVPTGGELVHLLPDLGTETEYNYFIYEDVVQTVNGTALIPFNRNRNSPLTSLVLVDAIQNANLGAANADTDVTGATLIYAGITGSARKAGGEDRGGNEFVLKPGVIYNMRLVCIAAGWADFIIDWYEHESL